MAKQTVSRKKKFYFSDTMIRIVAAWLGAWIPLWMLIGPCGVKFPAALPAVLFGYTVFLKIVSGFRKRLWRFLPKAALVLGNILWVLLSFEEAEAGFHSIYDAVVDALNRYYALGIELFEDGTPAKSELFFALLLPTLAILFLSDMASEGRFWIPWLLVSCIFPWMAILVDVFCPVWLACVYIGLVLFFLMTHGSHGLRPKVGARCRMFTIVGLALMMLVACLIISGNRYDKSIRDWKGRMAVGEFLTKKFPVLFGRNQTAEPGGEPYNKSGISGGSLPMAGHLEYSGEVAGTVTVPKDFGDLYLRTGAYGSYMGTAWVDSYAGLDPNYPYLLEQTCMDYVGEGYDDLLFELRRAKITVELTRESRYLPLPYQSVAPGSSLVTTTMEGVDQLSKPMAASYSVLCYYNPLHLPGIAAYADDVRNPAQALQGSGQNDDTETPDWVNAVWTEDRLRNLQGARIPDWYQDLVYSYYLDIPISRRWDLGDLVPFKENESVFDSILRVQKFLSHDYAYTTRPGKLPEGEDFIEYFLFTNKKGYCAYYASAAVMLFRSLGIPARYVEGYYLESGIVQSSPKAGSQSVVVHKKDGSVVNTNVDYVTVEITDQYAHAWVEVFIDDYGWYPVEVTHSYASSNLERSLAGAKKQVPETTPTPAITPSVPKNTPTPKPKTTVTVTPTPVPGGQKTNPKEPSEAQKNAEDHLRVLVKALSIIGLIAIPILLVGARWTRRKRIRRRKTSQRNVNAAFVEVCRDIGRVIRLRGLAYNRSETDSAYIGRAGEEYGHAEDFAWLYETGNRAAYSGEQIDNAERKRAIAFYRTLRKETLSGLKLPKRLIMKYLYVL
ncbi:MAG: transglutaminase domain-containing protein [Lachnospiraceae bacterium]|nr:transglutaminase domain-containing protein [Lachnospiraceae bacterium]